MRIRTLVARIERAEEAAKAEHRFSAKCICFPADEEPFFGFPLEEQIAVAPGVVDSPLHKDDPSDSPTTFQQMGKIVEIKDVVDAVLYLARAGQVTGETLYVDGGSYAGR